MPVTRFATRPLPNRLGRDEWQRTWSRPRRRRRGSLGFAAVIPTALCALVGAVRCADDAEGDEGAAGHISDGPAGEREQDSHECGNCIKEASEHCDDCNMVSGDGCSASCRLEVDCSDLLACCSDVICPKVGCNTNPANVCDRGTLESIMRNGDGACAATLALLAEPSCIPALTSESMCPDVIIQEKPGTISVWSQEICDGRCTDVSSDGANCGRCGNVCSTDAGCFEGFCDEPLLNQAVVDVATQMPQFTEGRPEQLSLNAEVSLKVSSAEGDPPPALRIRIPFTDYNQYVELEWALAAPIDLVERRITLPLWVDKSGYEDIACPGGIRFYVRTGAMLDYAQNAWINTPLASSLPLALEFDTQAIEVGSDTFDPSDVRVIGLAFETADCEGRFPPGEQPGEGASAPSTAVFFIDDVLGVAVGSDTR